MKRLYILFLTLWAGASAMTAQTVFDDIKIFDAGLDRENDRMVVNMDMDMSSFNVSSNRAVLLTPIVSNDDNKVALPSVGIYGRDRYFYYVRNDKTMVEGSAETSYRENELPDNIPYYDEIPYEAWMGGAELLLEKKTYGCCGDLLETEVCALGQYCPYVPSFLYIRPTVELRKERAIEGNAYVDFPVSRTEIYPEYHNNTVELAKIRATVDSVRLDPDVTVTSIFIKGFASPESPYDNNTRLAKGRTEAIRQYVLGSYDFAPEVFDTDFEPENWGELREWLVESDLPHRNQIIALIDKDEEPDRKEWLIKTSYPDDYKQILEDCYPYLRRTYYRIDYVVRAFTEADTTHIRELVMTRPQNLSLQEFYLAAQGLDPESQLFGEIFDVAVRMYPHDPVANLNAANAAMQRGDMDMAKRYLDRSGDAPEAVYARGVFAAINEDFDTARALLQEALSQGVTQAEAELEKLF